MPAMATFNIKLDDYAFRKLTEAAKRAGVTPERLAEMMVESWLFDDDAVPHHQAGVREPARAWTNETAGARASSEAGSGQDQLTTAADYDGPFVDLDEALDDFSAELNRRRGSPAG